MEEWKNEYRITVQELKDLVDNALEGLPGIKDHFVVLKTIDQKEVFISRHINSALRHPAGDSTFVISALEPVLRKEDIMDRIKIH